MVRLRTLGTGELAGAHAALTRGVLAQPRRWGLLVYLALAQPRGFRRRDFLLALFWPEQPTAPARNALRQALHFLRHAIGAPALINRGREDVGLDPARFSCDVVDFEHLLDAGRLAEALELYRGDLLPGFFISDAPEFEKWLDAERARLRDRAAAAARQLADAELARGNGASAATWARRATRLAPDDERGVHRLLAALDAAGDHAAALRAYDEHAARLREEFEVEPSAEARRLVQAIRARRAAGPAAKPLPPDPPLQPVREPDVAADPLQGPVARPPGRDRPAGSRRFLAAGAALAVVAVLLGAAWFVKTRQSSPGAEAAHDVVAVLPFPVRGRPELGYLRQGMVDLLSAKLDGAVGLRATDPRAVVAAARLEDRGGSLDVAGDRAIAGRLGAHLFVIGDVVEIAGRLHIDGALYEGRRPTPTTVASVEGDAARLFELVDDLAARLLAGRGRGRDTTLVRLGAVTTKSLPALKAYLDGEAEFRAGRDARASEAFQRAVAQDSTFALANYRLATVAPWSGSPPMRARAIGEAVRYADRLPPRVRQLLAGFRAYAAGDASAAESHYRAITVGHPDNVEAWFMLGETLFHYNPPRGRPSAAAREAFQHMLSLEPDDPHALVHLARLAADEGKAAELDSLVGRYLHRYAETPLAVEMRALRAFAVEDTLEQQRIRSALARTGDQALYTTLLSIALHDAQVAAAASMVGLLVAPGRDTASLSPGGHMLAAQYGLASGKWRPTVPEPAPLVAVAPRWPLEARALFAAAPFSRLPRSTVAALRDTVARSRPPGRPAAGIFAYEASHDPEVRAYLVGLLSARLADSGVALASAAELDRLAQTPGRDDIGRDLAHTVRAQLNWTNAGPSAALAELQQFRFDAPRPVWTPILFVGMHERFLYAELLRAVGREAEALDWYATSADEHDLIHLAPAHLRRAEIYERMGKRAEAIFHYARFLALWHDCDPELRPVVAQAQAALERLGRSPAPSAGPRAGR